MRRHALARGSALAGLAAASATAAHGGTAALSDPAWAVPALVAAGAGVAALLHLTGSASRVRVAAARVHVDGGAAAGHRPLGPAETAAIMLAAQGCAHLGLLAAGAPAHAGQTGALALHTALALLGGALVWRADRALTGALDALSASIAATVELLLALTAAARPPAPSPPAGRRDRGRRHGRAPPATA
jgi:hypothetical protein